MQNPCVVTQKGQGILFLNEAFILLFVKDVMSYNEVYCCTTFEIAYKVAALVGSYCLHEPVNEHCNLS